MADIWDFMDCEDCPYYEFHRGVTEGDPDSCYPDETECRDGDFGNDHPCDRMLSRIEEGVRDGDFSFSLSYLIDAKDLTGPEAEKYYWDVLEAWPGIDWNSHCYWLIFYDATNPQGFDTAKEIYTEVFQ
jgi:hypothetical protein